MEQGCNSNESFPDLIIEPATISRRILSWYARHQRDLPWRRTRDPYAIWVSEIMLQQTRVDTVIPYYRAFMERFPVIEALAQAPLEEVLKVWENLGYYSRARHLHKAAQKVLEEFGGKVPESLSDLLGLPGVGPYTAAAILSFAFEKNIAAVDGNVVRILCRVFAVQKPPQETHVRKQMSRMADTLVPKGDSSFYNQGLMDLGATICTPRRPACENCPVNDLCKAYGSGLQEQLPVIVKGAPIPHRELTAGIITDGEGRILIVRRPENGFLGGLWKFPGGEKNGKETVKKALVQRILEETGLKVAVEKKVASVKHAYTHFRITLHAFRCSVELSQIEMGKNPALQWASFSRLKDFPISKADRMIMKALSEDREFQSPRIVQERNERFLPV